MVRCLHNAAALLVASSLLSCGGSKDAVETSTPQPSDLPGVYAGSFPCSNCDSIDAALWLRPDGRFIFRQKYVGGDATNQASTYSLGLWSWDERGAAIVASGAGPERRFSPAGDRRLQMQTASPVPHLLSYDASAPNFGDRVRVDGDSVISEHAAVFTECLTELRFDVAETKGYKELRRQHRLLNSRGAPALTTVEAHLAVVGGREWLVVDKVIGLKPGAHCERPAILAAKN
jgi:copper homeostasis protein (lipoprotein)